MKLNSRYVKFIVPLILLLGIVLHSHAQNTTTITGTVTDSDSQVWAGAVWIARMNVPGPGVPHYISGGTAPTSFTGSLNSAGTFVTAAVGNNCAIVPAGTTWTFFMQSLTSASSSEVGPFSICGSTFAIGGFLSTGVAAPRIQATNLVYAYNTTEIINAVNGSGYVNTIGATSWLYNNGWVELGGGSGCTGDSVTGNVAFNNQIGSFQGGCLASVGNPFSSGMSCPQAGQRETGNATTNPFTCTFSYSNGTVASGTFGDGTNTQTLTTPFTSGSLAFAYSNNTTFTLHATATNSQTATSTASVTFASREFGGIGTAGATGATASGSTAILAGATGTLASVGLGNQSTFGPYTPSNQKIYVLGLNSSCTFTSGGFAFPVNTPTNITFVNQYGSSVSMYLYESTNLLSATFTLNGTC